METPAAEFDIDEALVDALVREQHPLFAGQLRLVTHGWDNVIYRLGERHAVRLPRRLAGAHLILNEQRWLPSIAARMPVAVPAPLATGHPSPRFPWPWSIVAWFDGSPADQVEPAVRDGLAPALAEALLALHSPAPADAPKNPVRGVPLAARDAAVRERLARHPRLLAQWTAGLEAPVYAQAGRWLHGDLHPANAVVNRGALTALIDFGDLTAGDPACDLASAWLFFGPRARAEFRERLGAGYDGATWVRARAWAVSFASAFSAASAGSARMAAVAAHAIEQLERNEPAE